LPRILSSAICLRGIRGLSTDPNYYIVLLLIIISWYISFKWVTDKQTLRRRIRNTYNWQTIAAQTLTL